MPGPTCPVSPSIACIPQKTRSGWSLFERESQSVGSRPGVGAGEGTVGDENCVVRAKSDGFPERFLRRRIAHTDDRYRRLLALLASFSLVRTRLLQSIEIKRVDLGIRPFADQHV